MSLKPSKFYTLPNSTFYPNSYEPIVLNFDHLLKVTKDGKSLFINKVVGYTHIKYSSEFEVELLLTDIQNKWKDYKDSL